MSKVLRILREMPEIIYTAFKYPVLLMVFGLNASVVVPLFVVGLATHGPIVIIPFLAAESPIIYMIAKETMRQLKQLPMSESWETSPEKWRKAFEDYKDMVENQKNDKN